MNRINRWLVATTMVLVACTCDAQEEVPKYLQMAREIVRTVKPENNKYQSDKDRNIRFPGDMFTSEYIVNTDCTGFVEAVLKRGNGISTRFSTLEWPIYGYSLRDYAKGIERGEMFDQIAKVQDLKTGDIVLWTYMYAQGTVALGAGHIVILDAMPVKVEPQRAPTSPGMVQWEITTLDSSPSPNSPDDTRIIWKDPAKKPNDPNVSATSKEDIIIKGGVGRGRFYLYTDQDGIIKGAAHAYFRDKIRVQDVDWHILMVRPRIK